MSKTIVIRKRSWLERHPVQIRRLLVRLIFSEAAQNGWDIAMEGARWRNGNVLTPKPAHDEPMSDAEWAMIMGHTPS